ncbi:tolloid-like protein 1 [Nematostella vectensis]|uniref:tolloid-like protein 1 n=1 Tax=Nematostella vectensis TaxID=45351 RepID=UPI002076E217|nr:tolloid-like protein 1 [Nematostella vectensis]
MTLTLVSVVNNGVKSHTGFNATFKVLRVGSSSENLTAPSGSLSSPNYPDHYGGNTDFTWKITAPQGHHVKLTFTAFRLEPSDNCSRYDYVLVRDEKADNPVLAYRCGAPATPMSFSSTGQEMVVKFHTDLLVADKGFLADYVVVANASPKPPITIPDSFSGAYYPVQHSTLNNQHTIKTIRTDSILSCLLMCQRLPGCKSVTITMQDAAFCACKLHNTSSKEVPGSLTEAVGSCLYELVEGFP